MPFEIIGEFGTPGADLEWLSAEGKLAMRHLKKICGEPPPEMELEIVWQEHELGNYEMLLLVPRWTVDVITRSASRRAE